MLLCQQSQGCLQFRLVTLLLLGFEFGRSPLVVAMPFRPVAVVAVAAAAYTAVVAERELDLHMRKKEDLIRTAVAAVVVAVVAAADFVFHNR